MAYTFTSILRAINRKPGSKLNILIINENEQWQYSLAKTGHNFFVLQHNQLRPWDIKIRPCPHNIHVLPKIDINKQIYRDLSLDLVICQNRYSQLQLLSSIATQLGCPIICIEHNYPNTEVNEFLTRHLADQPSNINIFTSQNCQEVWGIDGNIIHNGIDTQYFSGYDGTTPRALIIENQYNRKHTGFKIFQELIKNIPIDLFGDNTNTPQNMEHYLKLYQDHRMFIDTSTWNCNNTKLLEAMSVGCPIITTNRSNHMNIIKNGWNGFITNDIKEMIQAANTLLNSPELAKNIGQNARRTIIDNFNEENFVNEYNNIVEKVVGQASAPITGEIYED